MEKVQLFILRGQKQKALNYLEKIIGSFLPLFPDDKQVLKDRRIAWLTRIDLLRQMGKAPEALAWICLECELNPDNIEAQALKRRDAKRPELGGITFKSTIASYLAGQIRLEGCSWYAITEGSARKRRFVTLP